jgi:cyanophycin synthetase
MLFPKGAPSRIPIASITGTNGKTTTSRMLAHIHKMSGRTVGLATTDGVYIDGERSVAGDMTGPVAAQMVLRDPTVDLAVLETARGGLLRAGMGYRHCDVGAVLNIASDHLGLKGVQTLDDLAAVKRVVVEVAREAAILNADDLRCLQMAAHTEAKRIGYVTMNPRHDLVRQHVRAGGLAIVLEEGMNGDMITLYDHGLHQPLLWTHLIPATLEGKALHNVQNAMFAALLAYAMGVKLENIRHGLRTFDTTYFQAPGRMNVFEELPFKVILDYGHNPAAIQVMVDLVRKLEVPGRRICVLAAPGDRRDEDIVEIGRIAASAFDEIIVRRDDDLRGRGPDDVPRILSEALRSAGHPADRIHVIADEETAVDAALRMGKRGDLLLVFGDKISRCWKQITKFAAPDAPSERPQPAAVFAPPSPGNVGALAIAPSTSTQPPLAVPAMTVESGAVDVFGQALQVIADGRGVRLAPGEQQED